MLTEALLETFVHRTGRDALRDEGKGRLGGMEHTMNDNTIHQHIEQLVSEEHRLYEQSDDRRLTPDERKRLDEVSVQLDRYYDLLRQRRAKREFGEDPNRAHMRSASTVENYVE